MKKRIMQDIIPPEKRTIRRVPLGHTPRVNESTENTVEEQADIKENIKEESVSSMTPPLAPTIRETVGKRRWPRIAIIAGIVLVVVILILSLFSRATITITPRQENITVSGTFLADNTDSFDVVPFELFSITREEQEQVEALGEKYVEAKSSGIIAVFNDFSEKGQLLVANTRFQTPEGLVYRIQDPITVPGQTVDGDGKKIPGSIEVRVVADKSGDKYNIELSDFTLPGLKESGDIERFDSFFARSKTPMTGGFAGVQKTIDKEELGRATKDIDEKLTAELNTALGTELPEGLVMYQDAVFLSFSDLPQENATKKDEVIIRRRGTLQAIVFDEEKFAAFLAENTIATYDGGDVSLKDPAALVFKIIEKDDFQPGITSAFEFNISGQTTLVWKFDSERLQQDLAGKSKRDIAMVLSAYPSIEEADISLSPFWKQSFPEKIEKIHIEYDSK